MFLFIELPSNILYDVSQDKMNIDCACLHKHLSEGNYVTDKRTNATMDKPSDKASFKVAGARPEGEKD